MKIPSIFFPAHRNPAVLGVAAAWTACVLLFYGLAWRERLRLGHWPYFMDPQTMGPPRFPIHHALTGYAILTVFWLAVLWSALVIIQASLTRPLRPWHALAALLIAWVPFGIGLLADPGGVVEWFFD
jgi:hypothetical protein